jgi:hypothetical protein
MKRDCISLSTDEGRALIKLFKKIYDCDQFEMPGLEADEIIAAELENQAFPYTKLYFSIWNHGNSGFHLDMKLAYSKIILCILHTKAKHRNRDGTLIEGAHLHIYQQGVSSYEAIDFSKNLRDSDEIGSCLIDFLSYCAVTNLRELPVQSELL